MTTPFPRAAMADVLQGNAEFRDVFTRPAAPDGNALRGLAVICCMDSRVDPYALLGLEHGDAKILRNAGGRVTTDVLRTLVLATYLLSVRRVLVIAHTDCLMTTGTDADLHQQILERTGMDTRSLEFKAVKDSLEHSLAEDVARIRANPLLPPGLAVGGCVYDVDTGVLTPLDV